MIKQKWLQDKSALITGASSGIGQAAAIRLAEDGCNIFMVARRKDNLEKIKDRIASLGVKTGYLAGDVTDKKVVQDSVAMALELFRGLDILILAAGDALIKPFFLTGEPEYLRLLEVNSLAVVNFCKEAVRKINPGGSIVLITSPAGMHGAKGMSAYAFSKGGIVAFGKTLALELAPVKIRVNIISPGYVDTEMTRKLYGRLSKAQREKISASYPLGIGQAKDVAGAIRFLVSDEASWITGVVLAVDGGLTAGV